MTERIEIVLGFSYKQFSEMKNVTALHTGLNEFKGKENVQQIQQKIAEYNKTLTSIWEQLSRQVLEVQGYQIVMAKMFTPNAWLAETPVGQRTFHHLRFSFYFEPETFQDKPENALFGIALTGPKYSVLLDQEKYEGETTQFAFTPELVQMVATAQQEIQKIFPEFAEAQLFVRKVLT